MGQDRVQGYREMFKVRLLMWCVCVLGVKRRRESRARELAGVPALIPDAPPAPDPCPPPLLPSCSPAATQLLPRQPTPSVFHRNPPAPPPPCHPPVPWQDLAQQLATITGFDAVSLQPNSGGWQAGGQGGPCHTTVALGMK